MKKEKLRNVLKERAKEEAVRTILDIAVEEDKTPLEVFNELMEEHNNLIYGEKKVILGETTVIASNNAINAFIAPVTEQVTEQVITPAETLQTTAEVGSEN